MANILVVDDEQQVQELLSYILKGLGHQVSSAFNGQEALKALGLEPRDEFVPLPQLVILDVMMPMVDGYAVFRKLRAHKRTEKLPVIFLTARAQAKGIVDTFDVAGFFQKPFNPAALKAGVAKILGGDAKV